MVKLLLADLVVEIDNQYSFIVKYCRNYIYDGDKPSDIFISITEEEIEKEQECFEEPFEKGYLESICAYRKIALQLPNFDAFVMHGAILRVDDKGIAFLASSGTGKTTHTVFWRKLFPKRSAIINGDKPIIRFIDGVPYAYGTPWAGKERYNHNDRVVLNELCFLERAEKDEVINLSGFTAAMLLLNQVYRPNDTVILNKTYALTDRLLKFCNLRKIKCTKNPSAAETAYRAIFGE